MKLVLKLEVEANSLDVLIPAEVAEGVTRELEGKVLRTAMGGAMHCESATVRRIDIVRDEQ